MTEFVTMAKSATEANFATMMGVYMSRVLRHYYAGDTTWQNGN
jgi:hypothetical protein